MASMPAAARPEYTALVTGLPALMRDFDCELSPATLADVGVFVAALECVDRVLDPLPTPAAREALTATVLAAIAGEPVRTPDELGARLGDLHAVLRRRDRIHAFLGLARAILGNTEHMRTTRDARAYLEAIEREGVLMVELALIVFGDAASPRFAEFLRSVAGPANLLDKLLDMRADRRSGELALDATAWLHARVLARMVRGVPRVIANHPHVVALVRWGVAWIGRMAARAPM
jgi:hypothetical protein